MRAWVSRLDGAAPIRWGSAMRITLEDKQTGRTVEVEAAGASFGRDQARCQVVINEKSVSNLHGRIRLADGRWLLEDLGSSNGTYLGGKRLTEAAELQIGDEIAFFRYAYRVVGVEGGRSPGAASGHDARPASTQPTAARASARPGGSAAPPPPPKPMPTAPAAASVPAASATAAPPPVPTGGSGEVPAADGAASGASAPAVLRAIGAVASAPRRALGALRGGLADPSRRPPTLVALALTALVLVAVVAGVVRLLLPGSRAAGAGARTVAAVASAPGAPADTRPGAPTDQGASGPGATAGTEPPPAGTGGPVTATGRTPYPDYERKRDAIEKAVADDPTLLTRAAGVRPLYKKLHDEIARLDRKTGKKARSRDAYDVRLHEAAVYEATVHLVDELYVKAVEKPVLSSPRDAGKKPRPKKGGKKASGGTAR